MKGTIERNGDLTITLNLQCEKLEAPSPDSAKRQYLPCCTCELIQVVEWNVVSVVCDRCAKAAELQPEW